jgi:parallel beta-helix repeat protein
MSAAVTRTVPAQYSTIQAAINASVGGDVVVVSPGNYHEQVDFDGKAITVRSTNPADRAVVAATILGGNNDRRESVAFDSGETAMSVLTGFTLSGNNATGNGGAIRCQGSSPTIIQNYITNNSAAQGGGIACDNGSSPTIANNIISGNAASLGGGVFCSFSSCPTLTNNLICGNTATDIGDGFYGGGGGGIFCTHAASPTLTNNTISNNSGGGVYPENGSLPVLKNCIVAFNTGGGGLYVGDEWEGQPNPFVSYCDFYGNSAGDYVNWPDQTGPNGNLSTNPLFADAATGNYSLKSQGGRWAGTGWVLDAVSSPCIDAGDPSSPFNLEPAPNGGRINMGFDGNTAMASKAPPANPAPAVVAAGPTGTTVGVAANINVTFNVDMARPTAQSAMTINGVRASVFGGAFSWVGRKMIFNPTSNLAPGTSYKIIIAKGARSRAGVNMTRGFTWTFTTKPAAVVAVSVASAPTALGAQIAVNLSSAADVEVSIRNLAGREVAALTPGTLAAGMHSLLWDGKSNSGTKAPAGMYLVEARVKTAQGMMAKAVTSLRLR